MERQVPEIVVDEREVVAYLKLTGRYSQALSEVVARKLTVAEARRRHLSVSTPELQQAVDAFRRATGLHSAKDTNEWLRRMTLSAEDLEAMVETNLLIRKFKDLLEEQAPRAARAAPAEQASVRDRVYQDWLKEAMA